jgi:hypothetical protein
MVLSPMYSWLSPVEQQPGLGLIVGHEGALATILDVAVEETRMVLEALALMLLLA